MRNCLIIIFAAIAVRLALLALFDPAASFGLGDSAYFLDAKFGSKLHPPGYVAALWIFGVPGIFVFQTGLTVAVSILAERKHGLLAGLLVASSPFLALVEFLAISDLIACQLVFAAFLLLDRPAIAGLLLAAAILTRDVYQLLPAALIPFAIIHGKGRQAFLIALVAYTVVVPAAISRGGLSEGRLGWNLWIGTWERDTEWYRGGLNQPDFPDEAFRSSGERKRLEGPWDPAKENLYREAAIRRIREEPLSTAIIWVVRYPKLWLGTRTDQVSTRIERGTLPWTVMKAGFWFLNLFTIVLGFIGMLRFRGLLAVPILYLAAVFLPFHNAEARYSLAALPFFYVFTAMLAERFVSRRRAATPKAV